MKNIRLCYLIFIFLVFIIGCKNENSSKLNQMQSNNQNNISASETKDTSKIQSETKIDATSKSEGIIVQKSNNLEPSASIINRPKGFVIHQKTILYDQPDIQSKAKVSLKKGDFVFLIETILSEENGVLSSYPAWYQVELIDGKTGWVESNHVSFGH